MCRTSTVLIDFVKTAHFVTKSDLSKKPVPKNSNFKFFLRSDSNTNQTKIVTRLDRHIYLPKKLEIEINYRKYC